MFIQVGTLDHLLSCPSSGSLNCLKSQSINVQFEELWNSTNLSKQHVHCLRQVVMAVLVFPIPESPSWLVSKRLYARADRALAWLGRDQEEFATEIELDLQQRMSKVSHVVWLINN